MPPEYHKPVGIINKMFANRTAFTVIVAAAFMTGCGTSTRGPNGSKAQTTTGVSVSGYPGGQPRDAESPALASSSEQEHSNPGPKVPLEEPRKTAAK